MDAKPARIHGLDLARVVFLLLGIPFHVATISMSRGSPLAAAYAESMSISLFAAVTHSFRMFGFFLLSGYFSAIVIEKRGRAKWFSDRWFRLGIPFIAGLTILGSLQYSLREELIGPVDPLFGLPIALDQFWFLAVLLVYVTMLRFIVVEKLHSRWIDKALSLKGLAGCALILALGCWSLGRALLDVALRDPDGTRNYGTFLLFLLHLPPFFLGVMVYTGRRRTDFFLRADTMLISAAVVLSVLYAWLDDGVRAAFQITSEKGLAGKIVANFLELPVALVLTLCVMRLFFLVKSRSRFVDFLVAGAMTIYLTHMVWVAVSVYLFREATLPIVVVWLLQIGFVLVMSVGSYLVVRQNKVLLMLFAGAARSGKEPASVAPNVAAAKT